MLLPSLSEVLCFVLVGLGCTIAKNPETNPEYLGCYGDDKVLQQYLGPNGQYQDSFIPAQQRALPFEIKHFSDKRDCMNQCYDSGYKYAGFQNGDLCFCGENYAKYGRLDDSNCNIECRKPGIEKKLTTNFFKSCGGRWANAVYSVVGFKYEQAKEKLRKSWLYGYV